MNMRTAFSSRNIRNNEALSMDDLRARVPSIFAQAPHPDCSERYRLIQTVPVIEGLMKAGFMPMAACQSRSMTVEKQQTTKHMIRFRHPSAAMLDAVGQVTPEVVLVNANDRTSPFHLMAGLFRLACLNGMIVCDDMIGSVRVIHVGKQEKVIGKVIDGAYTVIEDSVKALEAPRAWSQMSLSRDERQAFAESAHVIRFGDAEGNVTTPVKAETLLTPRRHEDTGTDLWSTFNVVQENALRGGLHGAGYNAAGEYRRTTTRGITAIDADVKLNKALWTLAERMAKLKQVA